MNVHQQHLILVIELPYYTVCSLFLKKKKFFDELEQFDDSFSKKKPVTEYHHLLFMPSLNIPQITPFTSTFIQLQAP